MGNVKAILIAVSEYQIDGCSQLPLCKNDLSIMRKSLIQGLKVKSDNIYTIGNDGIVFFKKLEEFLNSYIPLIKDEDTLIFYFSGHGCKNGLVLTDTVLPLDNLIKYIENISSKNKVIILDSCRSGDFSIEQKPIQIDETISEFAGKGCAVLASCGAEEVSGFNELRNISLFTSFVSDALKSKYIIKKGMKSLEDIYRETKRYAEAYMMNNSKYVQNPVFRSTVNGTIYFNVENYIPYPQKNIYKEYDKFIIHSVEPSHNPFAKRYTIKVIIKCPYSIDDICNITKKIFEQSKNYEVYTNKSSKDFHENKPVNSVFCYFGNDIKDIIESNFIYRSVLVDDTQDKTWWYKKSKNSIIIKNVWIELYESYNYLKNLSNNNLSKDDMIAQTTKYTNQLINLSKYFIDYFQEFINHTISEEQMIENVSVIINDIEDLYFLQNDLPISPTELHNWSLANTNLSSIIYNFSLYYSKRFIDNRSTENRKLLTIRNIDMYHEAIKKLTNEQNKLKE